MSRTYTIDVQLVKAVLVSAEKYSGKIRQELRDAVQQEAKRRKNKSAVAEEIDVSRETLYKFLRDPATVADSTVRLVKEWTDRGYRPRSGIRAAAPDGLDIDRRLSEILDSTDLDAHMKSSLMLDAALVLRAEALRDRDRTARIEAELAARRHDELGVERRTMPKRRSDATDEEDRGAA